ncbi:substrate-binding periplasmic protein [Chitinimonas sp.]|uniref:substrate-binding periplasmic protein n=1 Tax=Chitinimonas sp. TaxID=1934313 RepID=UPI0035ADE706
MNYPHIRRPALALLCAAAMQHAHAAPPLRVAELDSINYPFVELDKSGKISGGLLPALGDLIARELGTKAVHSVWSRRRIEQAVGRGDADISCYSSPKWTDYSGPLQWTIATLPQIERVVVLKGQPLPGTSSNDFAGKRIATMLGYHYPSIQPLFDEKRATRIDSTRVSNLFRLVEDKLADALISSEAEIEGHFARNPAARERFSVATTPFSVVDTQCYISPSSPWPLADINKALNTLLGNGEIERLARQYHMSMR